MFVRLSGLNPSFDLTLNPGEIVVEVLGRAPSSARWKEVHVPIAAWGTPIPPIDSSRPASTRTTYRHVIERGELVVDSEDGSWVRFGVEALKTDWYKVSFWTSRDPWTPVLYMKVPRAQAPSVQDRPRGPLRSAWARLTGDEG